MTQTPPELLAPYKTPLIEAARALLRASGTDGVAFEIPGMAVPSVILIGPEDQIGKLLRTPSREPMLGGRRAGDVPASPLSWDEPGAGPRSWTLLLSAAGTGVAGALGDKFEASADTLERVDVIEAEPVLRQVAELQRENAELRERDAPAAGQAGLANSRDMTIARIVRDSICWVFSAEPQVLARIDDDYLESIIAKRAPAPVAADTEQAIPEGYKLVPLEPTREMLAAALEGATVAPTLRAIADAGLKKNWRTMLAAAPAAPADAGAGLNDSTWQEGWNAGNVSGRAVIDIHNAQMESNRHYRERVFNQIAELDAKDGLSRFARLSTPGAPVTAEPVAWIRKTDITELTDSEPETDGWTPLYTRPAPADRDAIRNEALEEAARVCEAQSGEHECPERASYCAEAVRALKSMERVDSPPAPSASFDSAMDTGIVPASPTATDEKKGGAA